MDTTKKRTLILSGLLLLGAALLRWPDFFGICAEVGTMDGGFDCYLNVSTNIEAGIPAFAFAEIILVAGVLWFFSSEATRRRWNKFGLIFIIISAPLLLLVHPYLRGLLGSEPIRSEVAVFLSLVFGVVSVILILISEFFARRKPK